MARDRIKENKLAIVRECWEGQLYLIFKDCVRSDHFCPIFLRERHYFAETMCQQDSESSPESLPMHTWEEIKKHTAKNDSWLVIDNKVYNITNWARKHPGGGRLIGHYAGEDATVSSNLLAFKLNDNFGFKNRIFVLWTHAALTTEAGNSSRTRLQIAIVFTACHYFFSLVCIN